MKEVKASLFAFFGSLAVVVGCLFLLAKCAGAHTLRTEECKWIARDVYQDALDRDSGETFESQINDFRTMRCASGDICLYQDVEDSARIMGYLADMYGPKHESSPSQLGGDAFDKCVAHSKDALPNGIIPSGPQIGS